MTDRYKGLTVAFKQDIRDDDAQKIIEAIRLLRGVADVKPVLAGFEDLTTTIRVNREWSDALYQLIIERIK